MIFPQSYWFYIPECIKLFGLIRTVTFRLSSVDCLYVLYFTLVRSVSLGQQNPPAGKSGVDRNIINIIYSDLHNTMQQNIRKLEYT
jgi:hypothetical protein